MHGNKNWDESAALEWAMRIHDLQERERALRIFQQ